MPIISGSGARNCSGNHCSEELKREHWWHHLTGHLALVIGAVGIALIVWIFGVLTGGGTIQVSAPVNSGQPATVKKASLRAMLLGADGRLSTSKSITAAWTVVVGFALIHLNAMSLFYIGLGADKGGVHFVGRIGEASSRDNNIQVARAHATLGSIHEGNRLHQTFRGWRPAGP